MEKELKPFSTKEHIKESLKMAKEMEKVNTPIFLQVLGTMATGKKARSMDTELKHLLTKVNMKEFTMPERNMAKVSSHILMEEKKSRSGIMESKNSESFR